MRIVHPVGWPRPRGYSNGVVADGQIVFVAGQVGWDEHCMFQTDDFLGQTRQALQNVVTVLAEAGATPAMITRMTWYVTDKHEYLAEVREVGRVYRELLGDHFPAMSLVQVAALLEDRARVEIEATAVIPPGE